MWSSYWFCVALGILTVSSVSTRDCADDPCLNGAECVFDYEDEETGDQFYCKCDEPYYGKICENIRLSTVSEPTETTTTVDTTLTNEYITTTETSLNPTTDETSTVTQLITTLTTLKDSCSDQPCENGGICQAQGLTFKCFCPSPFTGKTCSLGPCSNSPCKNGGICAVDGDSYSCYCSHPFRGRNCEISPCSDNPCENDGVCKTVGSTFRCSCKAPFFGIRCEKDACYNNPCKNGGMCKAKTFGYKCYCSSPFTGSHCEKGPCSEKPCKNNGICEVKGDTHRCFCQSPYSGKSCEIDPCSVNPCMNDGTCRVRGDSFKCYCKKPYHGEICQEGEIVTPSTSLKTEQEETTVVTTSKPDKCKCRNGYCVTNAKGVVQCVCNSGFGKNLDGYCQACDCGEQYNCTFEKPWFTTYKTCICPKNYEEVNGKCVEPCSLSPCKNGGTCRLTTDSFVCDCPDEFTGRRCQTAKCDCKNGRCITNAKGKTECLCNPGFGKNLDGHCQACDCGEQYNCTFEKYWFSTLKTCVCPKGYEEVNGKCIDPCSLSPCKNGGTCRLTTDSFVCDCPDEFTGRRCQTAKCDCKNGRCITNAKGKTECVCNSGFGKNLDGHCQACDCGEQYNCTFEKRWFTTYKTCICPKGYEEENGKCVDPCSFEPCWNGGICKLTKDSFVCECPKQFTGQRCERKICKCENGKCVKSGNELKCVCNSDHGLYSTGVCKACNCGKNFTCTFDKGVFWDKTYCVCPEGYSMVDKECIKKKT